MNKDVVPPLKRELIRKIEVKYKLKPNDRSVSLMTLSQIMVDLMKLVENEGMKGSEKKEMVLDIVQLIFHMYTEGKETALTNFAYGTASLMIDYLIAVSKDKNYFGKRKDRKFLCF